MKHFILGLAVLVLFGMGQANAESLDIPPTDLWDVGQGSVVTAHSPVLNWGGYSVSDIRNMFGYENIGKIEPDKTIFGDNAKGFVHWVEWQTPDLITLRSFALHAHHDGIGSDANSRGFSRFTLFAEGTPGNFDVKVFEIFPSNPYSTTPAPPNTIIESSSLYYEVLLLYANVTPITSQRFRAEFVQYGDTFPGALGPRIRELDGYDTFIVVPEPSTLLMLSIGAIFLLMFKRRK